ncbi:hypothetical protein GCM10010435_37040 [Winogradskya consettensis]
MQSCSGSGSTPSWSVTAASFPCFAGIPGLIGTATPRLTFDGYRVKYAVTYQDDTMPGHRPESQGRRTAITDKYLKRYASRRARRVPAAA